MRLELTTSDLEGQRSTIELYPHIIWRMRLDLNQRLFSSKRTYLADRLLKPYSNTHSFFNSGGSSWTRTNEAVRQQIYSLP